MYKYYYVHLTDESILCLPKNVFNKGKNLENLFVARDIIVSMEFDIYYIDSHITINLF